MSKSRSWGAGTWLGTGIDHWLGQLAGMTIDDLGKSLDMGLSSSDMCSSFWSARYSMDEYWQVCWLQGIGGIGRHGSTARNGRWTS